MKWEFEEIAEGAVLMRRIVEVEAETYSEAKKKVATPEFTDDEETWKEYKVIGIDQLFSQGFALIGGGE